MQIELDLSDWAINCINELSKEYETTPSEVVSALLIGFCLDNLTKDLKTPQKQEKCHLKEKLTGRSQ